MSDGYMFRGGMLMPVAMASRYDQDALAAIAKIKALLPDAIVSAHSGCVMAEIDIDGERWVMQCVCPDGRRWGDTV